MMSRTTLFAAALVGLAATPALAGDVVVEVTGVASSEGSVLCALHPEGSPFPGTGPGVVTASAPADPGGAACRFADVAAGTYAIAVFHDANGNQELDTNFLGIPGRTGRSPTTRARRSVRRGSGMRRCRSRRPAGRCGSP